MRETARELLARLGAELDVDAPLRTFRHRAAPDRGHRPRAGGRGQGHLHGRADVVADPDRKPTGCSTSCARCRPKASPSSSSAIASRKCSRFPAASPCCATASWSASIRRPGMTQSRLTELMTGKTFDQSVRARDHAASPVVLRVEGLTRAGDYEDVSLTIRRGETLGLTGLLGAGRTELALSIFGMLRPDAARLARRPGARPALQPRRDPRRHRLPLRGPAVARPDPAAVDRRQPGHAGARQDPRPRPDLASARRMRWSLTGSTSWRSRSAGRPMRSRRSRAAISSASPSPNGWRSASS